MATFTCTSDARPELYTNIAKEVISQIMDSNSKTEGVENFMDRNKAVEIKCECGGAATKAVAFRVPPRILCDACYAKKSMRAPCDEEFLVSALEVIERTTGLKATTLDALREMVTSNAPAQ